MPYASTAPAIGLPYWSRGIEGERRIPAEGGASPSVVSCEPSMSLGGALGDRSDGLRAVSGIRSSLLLSSFFSNEAKTGSLSTLLFAPLITGIVGCRAVAAAVAWA